MEEAFSGPQGNSVSIRHIQLEFQYRCECGRETRKNISFPISRIYKLSVICPECGDYRNLEFDYKDGGNKNSIRVKESK